MTATPLRISEEQFAAEVIARSKIKVWASRIRNNAHLRQVLRSADPAKRREVYQQIAPLVRFKVLPFYGFKF